MDGLDEFKASLSGACAEPGEDNYDIKRWAENAELPAKLIVYPADPADVSKTLAFAQSNSLDIAVKGGGHSTSGASSTSGGVVIDLSKHLRGVKLDLEEKLVEVGGGCIWEDVDKVTLPHGLAAVAGVVDHTGVGGLTLGGGYGWLTGLHGLVLDNLLAATVVIADGTVQQVSETENEDLFWGIRGGGGNFGVVTSFMFRLHPVPPIGVFSLLIFTPPVLADLVTAVNSWLQVRGPEESAIFAFGVTPADDPCIIFQHLHLSAVEEVDSIKPFLALGPIMVHIDTVPFSFLNKLQNSKSGHGDNKLFKGTTVTELDVYAVEELFTEFYNMIALYPETTASVAGFELYHPDKFSSVPADATAFAGRHPHYNVLIALRWTGSDFTPLARDIATDLAAAVNPAASGYANYDDPNVSSTAKARLLFGDNYQRLAQLKAKVDPKNIFNKWFPIEPAV